MLPGIAGLLAGIRFVSEMGVERIAAHERNLIRMLADRLEKIPGTRVFRCDDPRRQSGVLSVVPQGHDCEEVGEWLGNHGVGVRAGLHCAPIAHQTAGTLNSGTVRFSVSAFNTEQEICAASRLLGQFCRSKSKNKT
jgi:selenocysteine lyase/cysteine desulfurase